MATVISELFEESGMTVQAFADKTGLKYGTAYDIAKGVSKVENIGAGAFVRIAHVFGMTADDLLGDTMEYDRVIGSELVLTDEEREVIEAMRLVDELGKQAIMAVVRALRKE